MKEVFNGLYENEKPTRGTVVAGGYEGVEVSPIVGGTESVGGPVSLDKPIMGFLYSVSRKGLTEFWPLKLGKNMMGKSFECDVCLAEKTVSDLHAKLVIQQMKNPDKVVASLRDEGSTNGTMVNGTNIGFDNVEIKNGDILTIGDNYQLLFVLIDKKVIGLKPAENFMPMADTRTDIDFTEEAFEDPYSTGLDDIYRKGTVAYDGSSVGETGGTKVI